MKKCSWWKGHCLHRIDGTERKISISKRKKCSLEDDYVMDSCWGKHIEIAVNTKCCWCGKEKEMSILDYDISRAMQYPDYEGKK